MRKMLNKKGFTLAELLIVVAIIAVLVAIAIPIFTSQLEKARESTDIANIRDYYAEIATALVTGDLNYADNTATLKVSGGKNVTVKTALTDATGTFVISVASGEAKQQVAKWQTGAFEVAGVSVAADTDMKGKSNIEYTFTVDAKNTYLTGVAFS